MAPLVFAALIVTAVLAITWGTMAAALRQSHQDQVAMGEAAPESSWSITPAHLRNRRRGADWSGRRQGAREIGSRIHRIGPAEFAAFGRMVAVRIDDACPPDRRPDLSAGSTAQLTNQARRLGTSVIYIGPWG